jgi:hypothetical protein
MLVSEMLLPSFLLASSLRALVILQVATRLPLPPVLLTLKLHRLLAVAANALNTLHGFRILRIA